MVLQVGFIERFRYVSLARAFDISPVSSSRASAFLFAEPRGDTIDVVMDLMIHDLDLALSRSWAPNRHRSQPWE